jgi:RNA polymerase sigma-70 factor (ECF subfamily)
MKDRRELETQQNAVQVVSRKLTDSAASAAPRSFEELYRELFAFVWRSLRALGVREAALDDATQDVFVVVHRQLDGFEQRSSLQSWVFAIAYNVASNYRRREYRKGGLLPIDPATPSIGPDPEGELGRAQAWEFASRFLDNLDEPKRAVFVLTQLEGMKATEVADALAIPVNTVYTRLHHAKIAFREALATRDAGGSQ